MCNAVGDRHGTNLELSPYRMFNQIEPRFVATTVPYPPPPFSQRKDECVLRPKIDCHKIRKFVWHVFVIFHF